MAATIATLADILKDFYLGPIQEQLNNEVLALDMFEKAKLDWSGRQVIIPVHVSRNAAVGARAEGGALPGVGGANDQQGFDRLVVQAAFVYGRFQLSGPSISSAGSGGGNSFASYVDAEMTRLVTDVKNLENQMCFSGAGTIGYIVENAAIGAAAPVNFDGSFAELQRLNDSGALISAVNTVSVEFGNVGDSTAGNDAYDMATIAPGPIIDVIIGFDTVGRTLTLGAGVDFTLGGTYGTVGAAPNGLVNAWWVRLTGVAFNANHTAVLANILSEPEGIFQNLHSTAHYTADRTSTNGTRALQARQVLSMPGVGAAGRAALTLPGIQRVIDSVEEDSGEVPDVILCQALVRQSYVGLLQGTMQGTEVDSSGAGRKGDAGFGGQLSYAGIPIRVSRQCPRGLMIFLATKVWKMCQLQGPGFADLDGSVLSRTAASDEWQGFYRHYYQIVAMRPNANGILCGIAV